MPIVNGAYVPDNSFTLPNYGGGGQSQVPQSQGFQLPSFGGQDNSLNFGGFEANQSSLPELDFGGGEQGGLFSDMFSGGTLENIGTGFSIASDALGAFGALENAKTAKGQLKLAREEYLTNLQNQGSLTNAQLSDRQGRRVADDPNATPVNQYLSQYGAKDAQGNTIGGS